MPPVREGDVEQTGSGMRVSERMRANREFTGGR